MHIRAQVWSSTGYDKNSLRRMDCEEETLVYKEAVIVKFQLLMCPMLIQAKMCMFHPNSYYKICYEHTDFITK